MHQALHCQLQTSWTQLWPIQQQRLRNAIVASAKPKRNPIIDIERDVLPDGKPNVPWRRLTLKIQTTVSLQGLIKVYNSNRHKTNIWRPIHSAGILMRVGALQYYRLLQQDEADEQTSLLTLHLLDLMAPDLADQRVTRVMDGNRLAQLLVVLSLVNPQPPPELLDPLVREMMRQGSNKLPRRTPDLLAEVAAALARLGWREQQLWLAVAAAATETLLLQQQNRQQQQQMQMHQQVQVQAQVLQQQQLQQPQQWQQLEQPVLQQQWPAQQQQQQQWPAVQQQWPDVFPRASPADLLGMEVFREHARKQQADRPDRLDAVDVRELESFELGLGDVGAGFELEEEQEEAAEEEDWELPGMPTDTQAPTFDDSSSSCVDGSSDFDDFVDPGPPPVFDDVAAPSFASEYVAAAGMLQLSHTAAVASGSASATATGKALAAQIADDAAGNGSTQSSSRGSSGSSGSSKEGDDHTLKHHQQQQRHRSAPTWLSGDYPKLAGALATIGLEDLSLMQLLGSEALPRLPLMSLQELAQLAEAYAALGCAHEQLMPALAQQLHKTASRSHHSRYKFSSRSREQAVAEVASLIRAMHGCMQLAGGLPLKKQRQMTEQQRQLLQLLQGRVFRLSTNSSSSGSDRGAAALLPGQLVQLLEVVASMAASEPHWKRNPLANWTRNAVAAAGLDALRPQQLQAAAVALGELQPPLPTAASAAATAAAAAALAAAAVARSSECGAGALAGVLWGCVKAGHYDTLLADTAVEAAVHAAATAAAAAVPPAAGVTQGGPPSWQQSDLQQQQQQQWQQQQQQAGVALSPQQQAHLVEALQLMGRHDLVQTVMAACLV